VRAYLKATGHRRWRLFGPENEFFIFDNVRFGTTMSGSFFDIESIEAAWSSGKSYEDGNKAHRRASKGGYFPVPRSTRSRDLRSAMCLALEELGMKVEVHHHEVATAGQCEIGVNPIAWCARRRKCRCSSTRSQTSPTRMARR